MKNILKQALGFLIISGIGWAIDFSIFALLSKVSSLPVGALNFISSIPAVTFVFFTSTKKTFSQKNSRIKLSRKYLIYFVYQALSLICVSFVGQLIYDAIVSSNLSAYPLLLDNLKIIVKILITPVTMTANFIVMKFLIEKI